MIVAVRHAQPQDIDLIAANMRKGDKDEIAASHGLRPDFALRVACASSSWLRAGTVDGEAFCLFGVASHSILTGAGTPWLLGTDMARKVPKEFLKQSRALLPVMSKGFRRLENWVDSRNDVSIRWLKWLGFAMMPAEPFGIYGLPFHRFYMEV